MTETNFLKSQLRFPTSLLQGQKIGESESTTHADEWVKSDQTEVRKSTNKTQNCVKGTKIEPNTFYLKADQRVVNSRLFFSFVTEGKKGSLQNFSHGYLAPYLVKTFTINVQVFLKRFNFIVEHLHLHKLAKIDP